MAVGPGRRLIRIWQRHGLRELPSLIGKNIAHLARNRPAHATPDPFDVRYGTDTAAMVEASALDTRSPNLRHAKRYEASSEMMLRDALERLELDPREFIFVDFGSGKGRIVLVASTLPFERVVGVEFARDLHQIALANIARFPTALRRAPIEAVCADVAVYPLPPRNLVCFFANPFGPAVLAPLAERIARHMRDGHRVAVIYYRPLHADVFAAIGGFTQIHCEPMMLVLRA